MGVGSLESDGLGIELFQLQIYTEMWHITPITRPKSCNPKHRNFEYLFTQRYQDGYPVQSVLIKYRHIHCFC